VTAACLSGDLNAQPLVGHKKSYDTTDDQHNEPGVDDPDTGISGHLKAGIVTGAVAQYGYNRIPFSHGIKIRKAHRQNDFDRRFIFFNQNAQKNLSDVLTAKIVFTGIIPDDEFAQGCRKVDLLSDLYRFLVIQARFSALKIERDLDRLQLAVTGLEKVDTLVAQGVVDDDVFLQNRPAFF